MTPRSDILKCQSPLSLLATYAMIGRIAASREGPGLIGASRRGEAGAYRAITTHKAGQCAGHPAACQPAHSCLQRPILPGGNIIRPYAGPGPATLANVLWGYKMKFEEGGRGGIGLRV